MAKEPFTFSHLQNASAVLRISGPDANSFIQGQFTQDVRLSPGRKAYGLWLNQKGKVLADSEILRISDDVHLIFSAFTSAQVIRERLEHYLIADEVTIDDESTAWRALLLCGPGCAAIIAERAGGTIENGNFLRWDDAFVWRAWGVTRDFLWLLVPAESSANWTERLAASGGTKVKFESATSARIQAGIAAVPDDIGADDLPNEGGLDATAISYTKGCYLGQEVMSRLKNLGQVRRRLHIVRGEGAPPARKTELQQGGRRVGEIRSAGSARDGFVAFAMVSLVQFDPQQPLLMTDGRRVEAVPHG